MRSRCSTSTKLSTKLAVAAVVVVVPALMGAASPPALADTADRETIDVRSEDGAGVVAPDGSAAIAPGEIGDVGAAAVGRWTYIDWHGTRDDPGPGRFKGYWMFNRKGTGHGGFRFKGTLYDRNKSDGRRVYLEVAVEGYSPNEFRNPIDQNRYWNYEVWDPAQIYTTRAKLRTCKDIPYWPDSCGAWKYFRR